MQNATPTFVETASSFVNVLDYDMLAQRVVKDGCPGAFTKSETDPVVKAAVKAAERGLPADLTALASKHSPALSATLNQAVRRMQRHQDVGALDSSKLVRLARPSSAEAFRHDAAHAFRQRASLNQIKPLKIAICADMNMAIRVDPKYVPTMTRLAHVISEAAAMNGMQCALYAARGKMSGDEVWGKNPKPDCVLSVLKAYDRRIVPLTLRFALSHMGFVFPFRNAYVNGGWSDEGTGAIDYAHEIDGANFIVAIGTFNDNHKANVYLAPGGTLENMVATIHAALKAYMLGARAA